MSSIKTPGKYNLCQFNLETLLCLNWDDKNISVSEIIPENSSQIKGSSQVFSCD